MSDFTPNAIAARAVLGERRVGDQYFTPHRVARVHGIPGRIDVLVQRCWDRRIPILRIPTHEPTGLWVVVPGAEAVEAVEVVSFPKPSYSYVSVTVPAAFRQLANCPEAIVAIESRRPGVVDDLVFADALPRTCTFASPHRWSARRRPAGTPSGSRRFSMNRCRIPRNR